MVVKMPHVHGNRLASIASLMEGLQKRGEGLRGNKKFCTSLNLPGHPGLGIIDKGDV